MLLYNVYVSYGFGHRDATREKPTRRDGKTKKKNRRDHATAAVFNEIDSGRFLRDAETTITLESRDSRGLFI